MLSNAWKVVVLGKESWLRPMVERFATVIEAVELQGAEAAVVDVSHHSFEEGLIVASAVSNKLPVLCIHSSSSSFTSTTQLMQHQLVTVAAYETPADVEPALERFFYVAPTPGRVFTIEGGDGTGKQTQAKMLCERLKREGYPVRTLDFPHDDAFLGQTIRQVLAGKKGKLDAVHPLLFASMYAANRYDLGPILRYWVRKGQNIVLDRYSEANYGHQACKLTDEKERERAVDSLRTFEHTWLDLPESHRVALLQLSVAHARAAMADRTQLDEHEKDDSYSARVRQAFEWCAQRESFQHWAIVPCVDERTGERLSREALADNLWALWASEFVNRGEKYALELR